MRTESRRVEEIDLGRLKAMEPRELLRFAFEEFGPRAALGTSLQKAGVVLIDMAWRLGVAFRVFFIDTLMNPPETYELLDQIESRYGLSVERFKPNPEDIENLYRTVGQNAHYLARPSCCHARKVLPMRRAQETLEVWIAGLLAEQSEYRREHAAKACIELTHDGRNLLKMNPLLDWTLDEVDAYIREHDVPYNSLYDYESPYGERYFVIGCKCCHIPVRKEFGLRAGKFPWERGKKECGLHKDGSGI
jgi:phosphoadenylyl-sulfate reductase (thioredoxin)